MDRPKTIEEFRKWYEKKFNTKIDQAKSNYYEQVTRTMQRQINESSFWIDFEPLLQELNDSYYLETKYEFIRQPIEQPELFIKPFASYEEKIFRKNIINNTMWPNSPGDDWLYIDSSFNTIKDIIRTSYIVKYLDGVEILAENIKKFALEKGHQCVISYEAREQGYYAAHLDLSFSFEIPGKTWETLKIEGSFEIQITTQLQEVLKKLTHNYYETKRVEIPKSGLDVKKWQWDYKSEEFAVNYLGHILHYLEGMILEVRDRRDKK